MKYFKQSKVDGSVTEITKEKARQLLEGGWKEDFLADLFDNDKSFELFTAFSIISAEEEK